MIYECPYDNFIIFLCDSFDDRLNCEYGNYIYTKIRIERNQDGSIAHSTKMTKMQSKSAKKYIFNKP